MSVGEQFDLEPRVRGFANGIVPLEPMELTFGIIATMKEQAEEAYQAKQAATRKNNLR